jgi:bacterioferritin (cytochrome b1)
MTEKEKLLGLLNKAFETEYNDVFLYLREADRFRKKIVSGDKLGIIFDKFSLMELHHADRIAAKIIQAGGKVLWEFKPFEQSSSLRDILNRHTGKEKYAIALYNEILRLCSERDADFKLIIRGIIEEETEHLAKVEHIYGHLKG